MKLRICYSDHKYNSISLDKPFSDLLFQYNTLKDIFCLIQLSSFKLTKDKMISL